MKSFLENVQSRVFNNGLKVICLNKPDAPVVSFQVWYRVGSADEGIGNKGISHILEHMAFRGTVKVKSEEHAAFVNKTGGHCNAFTAEDMTAYVDSIPAEHLEKIIELEADRMRNLRIDPDLFEVERKVIIEEYHTYMNNPVAKAFLEYRSEFYKGDCYEVSPIGILNDIHSVSRDIVEEYYRVHYVPSKTVVVAVGDIGSEERLFELVEKYFCTQVSEHQISPLRSFPERGAFKSFNLARTVEFDVPIFMCGYPAPASADPHALSLDILQMLLTQGETSLLNKSLVREKKHAVMVGGMNHFLRNSGMSMFFAVFTPNVSPVTLQREMEGQISSLLDKGVNQGEMDKVKNAALTNRSFEFFSAENICHKLGFSETVDGSWQRWPEKLDRLETLTSDEIVEIGRLFFAHDKVSTLLLKPAKINPIVYSLGLFRHVGSLFSRGRSK